MMKETHCKAKYGASVKLQQHMVQCTNINYHQYAHNMPIQNNHKIFTLPQTEGKYFSFFEILHSYECRLFSKILAKIAYNDAIPENLVVKRKASHIINFSHPIYFALRNAYWFAAFSRKEGKGKWGQTVEDGSDNDE